MDKQNVYVYWHNGMLSSLKKQGNSDVCHNMDGPWGLYAMWSKSDTRGQMLFDNTICMYIYIHILNIHWKDWCWSSITLATWREEPTHWEMTGIDWGQEEKEETEDEMVGWHHGLNEHAFEWTPGDSEERNLVCCSPWGCKKLDTTEQLRNNNHLYIRNIG